MNLSDIKTGLTAYHAAKDVAADIKSRNIAALGSALSVLLALLLPFIQPLGAKYGITIDAATMGYVHDMLLGAAGLFLVRHVAQSGPAVAVVAGDGAPGRAPASVGAALDPPARSEPAQPRPAAEVRLQPGAANNPDPYLPG